MVLGGGQFLMSEVPPYPPIPSSTLQNPPLLFNTIHYSVIPSNTQYPSTPFSTLRYRKVLKHPAVEYPSHHTLPCNGARGTLPLAPFSVSEPSHQTLPYSGTDPESYVTE